MTGNRKVEEIISRGKATRPGAWSTLGLFLLTAALMWSSFTPLDWGPLAWICLIPMLLLARPKLPTRWMYRSSLVAGLVFSIGALHWMRLGDKMMYIAMVALGAYMALYWPLFLWLTRTAVHQLKIPLVVAAPVFWTGLEFNRAYFLTGFAWYFLGHTQYRWVELVQISDLFGVYAVTFVVVLANAALAQLVPPRWIAALQLCWPGEEELVQRNTSPARDLAGVAAACVLVLASVGYGALRRSQADFVIGPRIGLIQGNFPTSVHSDRDEWEKMLHTHQHLTGMTMEFQPDLIVWPEAMYRGFLWDYEAGMTDEELAALDETIPASNWKSTNTQRYMSDLSDMTNAGLLIGVSTISASPGNYVLYNSAAFAQPGVGVTDRYDKIHRVPFGEFIPLKDRLPFLEWFVPFRGAKGIDAGAQKMILRFRDWRLIPLICYEDTVPQLVKSLAALATQQGEEGAGVMVNLSNDGWFHGSSELDQHLITASFRCIETRMPMVRAVNTGISAVIDGDGVVREPTKFIDLDSQRSGEIPFTSIRDPRTGKFHKQLNCALIADVPLDSRRSFYLWFGDWLSAAFLTACIAVALQGLVMRRRLALVDSES